MDCYFRSQTELGDLNKPSQPKPRPPLPDVSRTPERKKPEDSSLRLNTETKPKVTIEPTPRITKQLSIKKEQPARDDKDKIGNRERQPSPSGLPRPASLPLNMSERGYDETQNAVQLQRRIKTSRLKEKPDKWKERSSEAAHLENISAELVRLQTQRKLGLW